MSSELASMKMTGVATDRKRLRLGWFLGSVAALFVLLLTGCATPSEPSGDLPGGAESVVTAELGEGDYDLFTNYLIQPGDVLDVLYQIRPWDKKERFVVKVDSTVSVKFVHAPELNEVQRVRPDGYISLPYIGEYYVLDKTVAQIHGELKEKYAGVLRDPELYVVIPEFDAAIKEFKEDLHTADRGLSRPVTVRPDGYVTFPMIGEMRVAKMTIREVGAKLNDRYERVLDGLQVDLFLERHAGSKVYVIGNVYEPGAYEISRPISVIQALALSAGYRPGSRLDSVIVARRVEGRLVARRINVVNAPEVGGSEPVFYLQPDDVVFVPKTWVASTAEIARDLANILMFRGWGLNYDLQH